MFSLRYISVLSVLLMILIAPPFLNSHEKVVVIPLMSDPPPAKVYTWQEPPTNIPDNGQLQAKINVPASAGKIADLNVYIFIDHTYNEDLDVSLSFRSSQGTWGAGIVLFNDVGYSDDGFCLILNDEAITAIGDVPDDPNGRPITGSYKTSGGSLSFLDGKDASGEWTLIIDDDLGDDSGRLVSWSLHIWEPGNIL